MSSYADVDAVVVATQSAFPSLSPEIIPKVGTLLARYETRKADLARAANSGLTVNQDFEFPKPCDLTLPKPWNGPDELRFVTNLEALLTSFEAHFQLSVKRALGAVT